MSEARKLYCHHGTFTDYCYACIGAEMDELKATIERLESSIAAGEGVYKRKCEALETRVYSKKRITITMPDNS